MAGRVGSAEMVAGSFALVVQALLEVWVEGAACVGGLKGRGGWSQSCMSWLQFSGLRCRRSFVFATNYYLGFTGDRR